MRCFLAIELPDAALSALERTECAIRELESGWRGEKWAAADVMHVTLRFLGELDSASIARIQTDFAAAAALLPAFTLTLAGLRAVPTAKRATMIWAKVDDPTGGCAALARAADAVAEVSGLKGDSRRFAPHVTLVRARRPRPVRSDVLIEAERQSHLTRLGPMSVVSASLFASTLTPHGPIHERLSEFVLLAGEGNQERGS